MKTTVLLLSCFIFSSSLFARIQAVYNDNKVEISWNNPKNVQIDFFVIERSKNGNSFKGIMTVDANNENGSSIEYYEIDYKPFNKKAYYRIKQVDIHGNAYYSRMVMAQNFDCVKPLFNLFSNKQKDRQLENYQGQDLLVVLTDVHQEEFIAKVNVIEENHRLVVTYANTNLPTGEYLVIATSDDQLYGKKLSVDGNHSRPVYTQNR